MSKIIVITVKLVPEALQASNSQIEREIREDSQIPWCAKIEKVETTIEKTKKVTHGLRI
jgi:hypothetical protein